MLAIGNDGNRNQRDLGHTLKWKTNVLYGVYSKIRVEFIFNQILELRKSKEHSKSNIPENSESYNQKQITRKLLNSKSKA